MLIIKREFKIMADPMEFDIIAEKLDELKCVYNTQRFTASIGDSKIPRVVIKGEISDSSIDELINWLKENVKKMISITL